MRPRATSPIRSAAALAAGFLLLAAAGCGGDDTGGSTGADSAAGISAIDTLRTTAELSPAGPAPQPTAEDAGVVRDALSFKLTDDNMSKFVRAGSSLAFLRARDSQVRTFLESSTGSRAANDDAALERLERHPQINRAIIDAGLSVRDYYTMSIAIASARRFIDDPSAAPPTPTLSDNAKFLRDNRQYMANLRVWGQ